MRQGFAIALIIGILFALWLLNTGRWETFWNAFKQAVTSAKANPGGIVSQGTLPEGKVPASQQPGVSVPPGGVPPYNPTDTRPLPNPTNTYGQIGLPGGFSIPAGLAVGGAKDLLNSNPITTLGGLIRW